VCSYCKFLSHAGLESQFQKLLKLVHARDSNCKPLVYINIQSIHFFCECRIEWDHCSCIQSGHKRVSCRNRPKRQMTKSWLPPLCRCDNERRYADWGSVRMPEVIIGGAHYKRIQHWRVYLFAAVVPRLMDKADRYVIKIIIAVCKRQATTSSGAHLRK
jgi:hypothetical protein